VLSACEIIVGIMIKILTRVSLIRHPLLSDPTFPVAAASKSLEVSAACHLGTLFRGLLNIENDTIRYDTIEEFNVDSKAEYLA